MIRKLVLPALAAALLGGCVTDYAYRGGDRGDYYYGQPRVEYRYDGGYGGYGGYAPYGYGGFGYGAYGTYGYPYRYYGMPYGYGGYYNRPYYPPYYRPYYPRPPVVRPRPDGTPPQHGGDGRRPPWRNYNELRRRPPADGGPSSVAPREVVPARPAPAESRERGSRMEQTIRRAHREAQPRTIEQEP